MDIIIETGFKKINSRISFPSETMSKAKNLVSSGHVGFVKEYVHDGVSFMIDSHILRQTSVTLTPYKVELQVIISIYINNLYFKKVLTVFIFYYF